MNGFYTRLKETYHYNDYEIGQIRYTIVTISSEISKIIILGGFFALNSSLYGFIVSTTVLIFLRCNTGGIHCKKYLTCLLFTLILMVLSIKVLPYFIDLNTLTKLCFLLICIYSNYRIGPIPSIYRKTPSEQLIRKSKIKAMSFVCTYILILYIIPDHQLIDIGFWTIILQSMQLVAAKIMKERSVYDERYSKKMGT